MRTPRSIARAFGKSGVCAFVLAPGWVRYGLHVRRERG